jgi:uncharacterized membrane protein YfcA
VTLDLAPSLLVAAMAISAGAALLQGVAGFGYALIAVPALALLDPRLAPVPQMLTALPLALLMAWRERAHIDVRGSAWVLGGRLVGLAAGTVLVAVADRQLTDVLIGLSVVVGVACVAARGGVTRTPGLDTAAGAFSGASGYVSGIGGPPLALLFHGARGPTMRATLAAFFALGLVLTLTTRSALGQVSALDLQAGAMLLVPVMAGTWASRFLHGRAEGGPLRAATLALSAAAGLGLLWRAL